MNEEILSLSLRILIPATTIIILQKTPKNRNSDKPISEAKLIKQKVKIIISKTSGKGQLLLGKCPDRLSKPDIDENLTHQWLQATGLKGETRFCYSSARSELTYQSLPCKRP